MTKYTIAKCCLLGNKWVVFERLNENAKAEVYRSKSKRDCLNFVKERLKKWKHQKVNIKHTK